MRSFIPRSCAYLFLLSCVVGASAAVRHEPNRVEDVLAGSSRGTVDDGAVSGSTSDEAQPGSPTVFNGIEVPPMKELAGEGFDTEIKDGYWYANAVYPSSLLFCLATGI